MTVSEPTAVSLEAPEDPNYRFDYAIIPGLPLQSSSPSLPPGETLFQLKRAPYLLTMAENVGRVVKNIGSVLAHDDHENESVLERLSELVGELTEYLKEPASAEQPAGGNPLGEMFKRLLEIIAQKNGLWGRPSSLEDYRQQYGSVEPPAVAAQGLRDDVFAWLRLAGPNPVVLRTVQLPELDGLRLLPSDADYRARIPGDGLHEASDEGRLFIADYAEFEPHAQAHDLAGDPKYGYAPAALFAVPPVGEGRRELQPVAIRIGSGAESQLILRPLAGDDDTCAWDAAKIMVQVADESWHTPISHFLGAHVFMEAIAVTSHRMLPSSHPILKLLEPHVTGTIGTNSMSVASIASDEGFVAVLGPYTGDELRQRYRDAWAKVDIRTAYFNEELDQRGVHRTSSLPEYPFRDDGKLLWAAIAEWIHAYVIAAYDARGAEPISDPKLDQWLAALAAPANTESQGAGFRGVPTSSPEAPIRAEELCELLTAIVFRASAYHWSVHYPTVDTATYAPVVPACGSQPVTAAGTAPSLDFLPPLENGIGQITLGILSDNDYTKLGSYPDKQFVGLDVEQALHQFRTTLETCEAKIAARNREREQIYGLPYPYMLPSRLPRSVNV